MVSTQEELGPDELVLDVRGLRMRYGTTDVLDGVDLQARRGEGTGPARAERGGQDHHR
jgi:ABC-type branched-subunit amino acid transport system ATPase component